MSGNLRSELSTKNRYWISKYRYLELKNYCLQYREWEEGLQSINMYPQSSYMLRAKDIWKTSDPTEAIVELKMTLMGRMKDILKCCEEADSYLAPWLLKAVTRSIPYEKLKAQYDLACGRDMFYDRYRKFFWLLDKIR